MKKAAFEGTNEKSNNPSIHEFFPFSGWHLAEKDMAQVSVSHPDTSRLAHFELQRNSFCM